jgi:hypothetical protein
MKISVNDQELFTLNDTQIKVLQNEIDCNELESDLKRRLEWVIMHKYEYGIKNLKNEWMPKLKENGVTMIPTDDIAFAELVFSQPNYKDRMLRDCEAKAAAEAEAVQARIEAGIE